MNANEEMMVRKQINAILQEELIDNEKVRSKLFDMISQLNDVSLQIIKILSSEEGIERFRNNVAQNVDKLVTEFDEIYNDQKNYLEEKLANMKNEVSSLNREIQNAKHIKNVWGKAILGLSISLFLMLVITVLLILNICGIIF